MHKSCIMVDMETISTKPNACILSLAAVKFDLYDEYIPMDGRVWHFDIDEQTEKYARDVDEDTLGWWASQGEAAIQSSFSDNNRQTCDEIMSEFHKFCWNTSEIWSQGTIFDITILENLLTQMNRPTPWNFRQIRDTRTMFGSGIPYTYDNPCKHDPLADCVAQALAIQQIFKWIKSHESDSK
jgi:hypothetical protein